MSDYLALSCVAAIGIAGGLYVLRAARQRRARRFAAVDAMMVFQASQIAAGAGHGVDLKAVIEDGRR